VRHERLQRAEDRSSDVGTGLDKLASNVSVGRNIAGIHWRTDGLAGLRLGESGGVETQREMKTCFSDLILALMRFDGTRITG